MEESDIDNKIHDMNTFWQEFENLAGMVRLERNRTFELDYFRRRAKRAQVKAKYTQRTAEVIERFWENLGQLKELLEKRN